MKAGDWTATIIAVFALAVSAIAAWLTFRNDRQSATTTMITGIIAERMRDAAHLAAERCLADELWRTDPEVGMRGLPEPLRTQFAQVGTFYESIGALSAYKSVNLRLVIGLLEYRIRSNFEIMYPFIMRERRLRSTTYLQYFESLYVNGQKMSSAKINRGMKLQALSAEMGQDLDRRPRGPTSPR